MQAGRAIRVFVNEQVRLRVVAFALLASLPLLALPPVVASASTVPRVHTLSPSPGEVLGGGATWITARVRANDTLTSVWLTVDDGPVDGVQVGTPDERGDVVVNARVFLSAGEHAARVDVEDAQGQRATRTWSFHATERSPLRLSGASRFETAVAISAALFPSRGSATAAVVARADDFADALAGAPLAATVAGPLLLAEPARLPPTTADELRRVLATGATVHVLGGAAAVSEAVVRDIEALGFRAVRHAGRDRFATAAAVARVLPPSPAVILASGASFPDALAASAPAARERIPVLLTAREHLPEPTAAVLRERDVSLVTLVGGTAVVAAEVQQRTSELVDTVRRVAGRDRYSTAVAIADLFYERSPRLSLANAGVFADGLAGSVHAASLGQPLLLTGSQRLPDVAEQAVRSRRAGDIAVYGGPAAVPDEVAGQAARAALDGPDAPRVTATTPAHADDVSYLGAVTVTLDRPVDPLRASVYLEVAGVEVPGEIAETGATTTLTMRVAEDDVAFPVGRSYPARVVVAAAAADGAAGRVGHGDESFTYTVADPVFAAAGAVALHLPSRHVELVAFHESSHDGAQQLALRDTATLKMTLPSRNRGTGSRSAADVVAAPDLPVLAPVTGLVLRAGAYVLYCKYSDNYAVIEPDDRPGWEVKILHFQGLRVRAGDHVVASRSILGDAPRQLPFRSQVDAYSQERNWPHVHLEVVDPSVPDRPGGGC